MAGRITTNQVQLGDSATASQNFHLQTNVDGTLSLNRGNVGASLGNVLQIAGTETVQRIQQFTAQTASGTSVDFLNIPSWAKEITVMFNGVSLSGTSTYLVQAGSGAIATSGYNSGSTSVSITTANTTNGSGVNVTNGIALNGLTNTAASNTYGHLLLTNVSSNIWVASGNFYFDSVLRTLNVAGNFSLAGILDRIRITTVNGTDTFDAGSINILVKG